MIHDILKVIWKENGKIKKTEIAVKTKIRWKSFSKYHDMLIQQNLIAISQKTNCYKVKLKGLQVLRGIEKLNNMLK